MRAAFDSGHWPLSILVSCKDHTRKINISDIGTFCNEVNSTGASTGVIYSKSGFTKPAVAKAKANGLACCRLYKNESPDIPNAIWFEHFACSQSVKLVIKTDLCRSKFETWNDLFDIRDEDTKTAVLDMISETFISSGDQVVSEYKEFVKEKRGSFPEDWIVELRFTIDGIEEEVQIQICGHWKRYHARLEASLLNGSYCLTDESFKGQQIGPFIDMKGDHPGKYWEEITEDDFSLPSNMILVVLHHPTGTKNQFREVIGPQKL